MHFLQVEMQSGVKFLQIVQLQMRYKNRLRCCKKVTMRSSVTVAILVRL